MATSHLKGVERAPKVRFIRPILWASAVLVGGSLMSPLAVDLCNALHLGLIWHSRTACQMLAWLAFGSYAAVLAVVIWHPDEGVQR